MRIGVDHHGNIDGIGNGTEIGFDLRIAEREIGFENRKNAVGTELLTGLRLRDRIRRRGRGDASDHRHAAFRGFDRGFHHHRALHVIEIGELAGRAERRQPVHTGFDEIVAEPAEYFATDLSRNINRRDQIGKDAVEISHGGDQVSDRGSSDKARTVRGSARVAEMAFGVLKNLLARFWPPHCSR